MYSFKKFLIENCLLEIEIEYGSITNFIYEAQHNVIDMSAYNDAVNNAKVKDDNYNLQAKNILSNHLRNYGRSFGDGHEFRHLKEEELHTERDQHLAHLKHLAENDPVGYYKIVKEAKSRLPKFSPYAKNRKTATMKGEFVNGHEVISTWSNKGKAGSVTKFHGNGEGRVCATCTASKQACRGEGKYGIGAPCLGQIGSYRLPAPEKDSRVHENLKTMKAPAKNGAHYKYANGSIIAASPHLDFATLEYDRLYNEAKNAKRMSQTTGTKKIVSFRQNTQNESSAMHFDQLLHHLPHDHKDYVSTNNYSASLSKLKYDPDNPSDRSTHDGILHNTNYSVKGPEVTHSDKGSALGFNPSSNVEEASTALSDEYDSKGNLTRKAQNAYLVAGGTVTINDQQNPTNTKQIILKQPKKPRNSTNGLKFHQNNAPEYYIPHKKLSGITHARIYGKEITLQEGQPANFHHPHGWGHETHFDPYTQKHRTFEYQDYHVHTNIPKPNANGIVDFKSLTDNVGADERKPVGPQIRRDRNGHAVGSVHIAAPTAATSFSHAKGTIPTDNTGKILPDKFGLANDPFVFPIEHHIDKTDSTRFNLNHPIQKFNAEEAERSKKYVSISGYKDTAPKTRQETQSSNN